MENTNAINLIFTAEEDDFNAINAVMAPDYQMKEKSLDNKEIVVTEVLQTQVIDQNGEQKISTTLVDADGISYQTLSDFVDRLVHAINQKRPAAEWKEKPVTIKIEWKESRNGRNMLAPKVVSM